MDTATETVGSETSEATEKTTPASSGTESVASDASQGEQDNAGGSQDSADGGKGNGTESRRELRKPSKNQTIYELRQAVRERDQKLQSFEERLAQFEQKFQPRQERKPSRTFWEAPEEVLDERISGHLSEMEKRILQNLQETRERDQQTAEWKQETLEATKLIKDTLKLSFDEEEELSELLRSRPAVRQMSPLERADYAIYLWNKEKGVMDKAPLKNKAATVTGAGVQQGGPKQWTTAEIEREMSKFPTDPKRWDEATSKRFDEIDREIKRAYAEDRVRK